jgi:protein MpaA
VSESGVKRLGRNQGGYRGETIDIAAVLDACTAAARKTGWQIEVIPASPGLNLLAFLRPLRRARVPCPPVRAYLSTGIHGDEPAGPVAVLRLMENDVWPAEIDLCLLPCLNPAGFSLNRRENTAGADLNRDYRHLQSAEVRAQVAWLQRQPAFEVTLCLHEDWEARGFYMYELNPEKRPSLAPPIIEAVAKVCPIDLSDSIEGRPASGGIIRPNLDPATRPQWPEAFWLLQNKTRLSYTLEAPSDFPLETRVGALVTAVTAALRALQR